MTKSFTAQLDAWALETNARLDAVTKQATNDLIAGIEVAPGMVRSGSYAPRGTIPRMDGALAASLQSSLYGSTGVNSQGEDGYTLVVASMQAGDTASFSWGGAVAPYAMRAHYGDEKIPGTFWIDEAAANWQGYVSAAVQRAKAQVGE